MFACSTNLINIYILVLKKASDFHKTNSCELFMILADVTIRKKRLTLFYTKNQIGRTLSFYKNKAQASSFMYRKVETIFKARSD